MERSKFYQFFPPPQFLQMPAVGVDISDATLRFVELVETRKGLELGRFGQQSIPKGVIESGEIKKIADFRAILSDLKTKHGLEYVAVCLPEERAYLFDVHIPAKMKYAEVSGAIELSLEEYIPLTKR
jgi:Tfp pilus assembly PilM family ATPase